MNNQNAIVPAMANNIIGWRWMAALRNFSMQGDSFGRENSYI